MELCKYDLKKHEIKLIPVGLQYQSREYRSIVFDLHNKELPVLTDYLHLNIIYDSTVGLHVRISRTQLSKTVSNSIRQVEV